jgi:hypothetical protein
VPTKPLPQPAILVLNCQKTAYERPPAHYGLNLWFFSLYNGVGNLHLVETMLWLLILSWASCGQYDPSLWCWTEVGGQRAEPSQSMVTRGIGDLPVHAVFLVWTCRGLVRCVEWNLNLWYFQFTMGHLEISPSWAEGMFRTRKYRGGSGGSWGVVDKVTFWIC